MGSIWTMSRVNGSLTQTQMNTWGSFLATLHAATSAHGLKLSEAVQVSPPYIIPKAYLSDIDQYNVMVYDLDYNSSARTAPQPTSPELISPSGRPTPRQAECQRPT